MFRPNALRVCLLSFFVCACGESVEERLNARIDSASVIYHFGCDAWSYCSKPNRMCGDGTLDALRNALAAGEPVAIEVEAGDEHDAVRNYLFVEAAGGGVRYRGNDSDTIFGWGEPDWTEDSFRALTIGKEPYDGPERELDCLRADDYEIALICYDS